MRTREKTKKEGKSKEERKSEKERKSAKEREWDERDHLCERASAGDRY